MGNNGNSYGMRYIFSCIFNSWFGCAFLITDAN